MPARRRRDRSDECGVSAVELAVLGPVFLVLVFFAVQVGLYFYGRTVAVQAAREGVAQIRTAPDRATFDTLVEPVTESVTGYARTVGRQSLLAPSAAIDYDDEQGRVTVTVRGYAMSLLGLSLPVTAQATGVVERFRPESAP